MAKGKLKVVPGDLLIDAYGFPIFVLAVTEENKTTLFLSSTGLISGIWSFLTSCKKVYTYVEP
jgi:hypothetical protein